MIRSIINTTRAIFITALYLTVVGFTLAGLAHLFSGYSPLNAICNTFLCIAAVAIKACVEECCPGFRISRESDKMLTYLIFALLIQTLCSSGMWFCYALIGMACTGMFHSMLPDYKQQ